MRRPAGSRVRAPKLAALAAALGAAAGCTNLFHSDAKPEQTYVLRAPAAAATAAQPATLLGSLQVEHPITAPGLDGAHIMLVQADHRMNFYLGSRWPAPLPDVVEALAVDTLRASGEWQTVQDSGSPFFADYLLQISVRRFEADYTQGRSAPQVEVVLDCTLGARRGHELVGTFVASGSAAAAGDRMNEVIAAFEAASSAALSSLSAQAAGSTRAFAARGATSAH
ncbi:MAG TPA: ABC-type transport auxiliary lipoprotein family protein [Steroidobacteraceae bacterium]|nr:ABC-type transport auxiliary lipoprotein family protein [Steroidobacteraceae bacterium]